MKAMYKRNFFMKLYSNGKCGFRSSSSFIPTMARPKKVDHQAEFVEILNKKYKKDDWTNIGRVALDATNRRLHLTKNHPLNLLTLRIRDYFYSNYKKRSGNPLFSIFDNFHPVVSTWQNFDSLLVPADHVSRSKSDTYYVNKDNVLRAHTSAHQHDLLSSGLDHFLVVGDVYRRDEVDRTHYPCFHQMEGVYLFTEHEVNAAINLDRLSTRCYKNYKQLFRTGEVHQNLKLFEDGVRTKEKQESHTFDSSFIVNNHLKTSLEGLARDLFGQGVECRWVDAYFPFTHPSFELEIFYNGEWLETLGCGVIEQELLRSSGAGYKVGWAFGLGLERLAMRLYDIPDIRLFWSKDPGFLNQFVTDDPKKEIKYKPIGKYRATVNDMSMWLPENNENYSVSDFYDLVRQVGGDIVERIHLFDDFLNPKTNRRSHAFKITYCHMERPLSQSEITLLHNSIADQAEKQLGVTVRR